MDKTLREAIMDVIRTIVKSYGGFLVASGMVTNNDVDILAGSAAIIGGLIWSWVSTRYFTKEVAK